jgi:hypothetical protein
MKISERLSALGVFAFAVGALALLSAPMATLSPAIAQQITNTTSPELAPENEAAMVEEHGQESSSNETHQDTFTVRDSVFALLSDQTIPASGFIHLYDTTPYSIKNGHIAAKIPCDDDSTPLLNILVGVAPELTPAPLELVANLSTPGELCLYHTDLPAPEQVNATTTTANATTNASMITDIAISNPGDEDITLPSTSTVVIGINEIEKGAHTHEEEEEEGEGEQAQTGTL